MRAKGVEKNSPAWWPPTESQPAYCISPLVHPLLADKAGIFGHGYRLVTLRVEDKTDQWLLPGIAWDQHCCDPACL